MRKTTKIVTFIVCLLFLMGFPCQAADISSIIKEPDIALVDTGFLAPYPPVPVGIPMPDSCTSCTTSKEDIPLVIKQETSSQDKLSSELKQIFTMDSWQVYLYLQETGEQISKIAKDDEEVNQRVLDAVYIKPKNEEKEIRDLWAKTFGFDVWYPYYEVKRIEKAIKEKISFKIFKMKCKPRFEKGHFTYTCSKKF